MHSTRKHLINPVFSGYVWLMRRLEMGGRLQWISCGTAMPTSTIWSELFIFQEFSQVNISFERSLIWLVTIFPSPPRRGWLWQPVQEFVSGAEIRLKLRGKTNGDDESIKKGHYQIICTFLMDDCSIQITTKSALVILNPAPTAANWIAAPAPLPSASYSNVPATLL